MRSRGICIGVLMLFSLISVALLASAQIPASYDAAFINFADAVWPKVLPNAAGRINQRAVVGILAAPARANPLPSGKLVDLPGKTVGYLYLPFEPNRFRVKPGGYSVRISDNFTAQLLDSADRVINEVPATIQVSLRAFDSPEASLDESVCYKFDRAKVCI